MLKTKERKTNQKVLQIQQSRVSYKRLQVRTKDKEVYRKSQRMRTKMLICYSQQRDNKQRELNIHTDMKTLNRKEPQLKALVNSKYIHTSIDKQLVKEERIKMAQLSRLFDNFNTDGTKSGKHRVTQFVPLELEINEHIENKILIQI